MASRKKGKGYAPKGKYAQIPVDIAKNVLGALSAPEFRVWFSLCMQCQHWANGTGKLCRSVIREFHLGSQRIVTAASKQLIAGKYIIRTRAAKQRICALYGVTHLPLNVDALAKEGLSDAQIRAALRLFSDSNRGSANSATTSEALNDEIDNRESAKPAETPLALPQGKRIAPFPTDLALPHGNTSKNLPLRAAGSGAASSPQIAPPAHPPKIGGRQKIEKLMRLQADLGNGDIARISGEPLELVAEVRRSLESPRHA